MNDFGLELDQKSKELMMKKKFLIKKTTLE